MDHLHDTSSNTFCLQQNEMIKSLQYCKLGGQSDEKVKKWMERSRIAVAECNYEEFDREIIEQFIHRLNYNEILTEIT